MAREKLTIIDLTSRGQGVGRTNDGRVVFVNQAVPGDILEADLVSFKKNIWQAKNTTLIEPSPYRIKAPCPYFPACGGCQIQDLSYDKLIKIKSQMLYNNLERIGQLNMAKLDYQPILKAQDLWHYRNHIQVKIAYDPDSDKFIKGFYREKSNDIVNHSLCLLALEEEKIIWEELEAYLLSSSFFSEIKKHLCEVIIRHGEHTGELLLGLVLDEINFDTSKLKAEISVFAEKLDLESKKLVSIYLLDEKREQILLWGKEALSEQLFDKKFQIYPRAFFQVNTKQAEKLFGLVKQKLAHIKAKTGKLNTLYDLYCGTGVIGILLAEQFAQVRGVDSFADSIKNAKVNAQINQVTNIKFERGRAEDWLLKQNITDSDVIIVDPPRKGLDRKLVETLMHSKAANLIYVSCNPASLARDIKLLSETWTVKSVQPVDLFPWTMHVETVVLMSRDM